MISFLPLPSKIPKASATRPPPTPNAKLRPAPVPRERAAPPTSGAKNLNLLGSFQFPVLVFGQFEFVSDPIALFAKRPTMSRHYRRLLPLVLLIHLVHPLLK